MLGLCLENQNTALLIRTQPIYICVHYTEYVTFSRIERTFPVLIAWCMQSHSQPDLSNSSCSHTTYLTLNTNQTTKWAKGALWSVQPFLRLTASLGCLTDILTITGVVLTLTGFRLRPRRAYKALGLINSTLFGCQGLVGWISGVRTRSGVVATKKLDGVRHFGEAAVSEAECGPCPVFALYPGIRLATEEKSRKTLSQGSRKVPAGPWLPRQTAAWNILGLRFGWVRLVLGQRKYLPSCRT
jgi:hypothetical protein